MPKLIHQAFVGFGTFFRFEAHKSVGGKECVWGLHGGWSELNGCELKMSAEFAKNAPLMEKINKIVLIILSRTFAYVQTHRQFPNKMLSENYDKICVYNPVLILVSKIMRAHITAALEILVLISWISFWFIINKCYCLIWKWI